jgi:esterase/lipase
MSRNLAFNNTITYFVASITLLLYSVVAYAAPSEKIGVISLHAKWSMPSKHEGYWKEIGKLKIFQKKFQNKCGKGPWRCSEDKTIVGHKKSDLRLVEFSLHKEGILIEAPMCAWSKLRKYDLTVDEALRKCITPRIERLKKRGAEKIVILGKSLGANMAIRAGAIFDGITGIVAMGPGHRPAKPYMAGKHTADVAHALNKIKDGKGDEKYEYLDINQGEEMQISISAKSYYSFFSPDGNAVMGLNAPKMKNKTPLMWIAGDSDVITTNGDGRRIFDTAPKHPRSKYIEVSGGHGDVGENGADKIVEWIKSL